MMYGDEKLFVVERLGFDLAGEETKPGTEIDSDTSSSDDVEVHEKVVNLCDVLKEFMRQHPEADFEEEEGLDEETVPDMEELRFSVRSMLVEASRNGSLHAAFCEAKGPKIQDTQMFPPSDMVGKTAQVESDKACEDPFVEANKILQSRAEVAGSRVDVLAEARASILTAAFDGRLAAALDDTIKMRPTSSLESMKLKAQAALSKALFARVEPAAVAEKTPETSMQTLRDSLKESLCAAACDGRLESAVCAVKETRPKQSLDDLWLMLKSSLSTAAGDGRLHVAIADTKEEMRQKSDVDMKHQIREALVQAMNEDTLQEALAEAKEEDLSDAEVLRLRVREIFIGAVQNGQLEAMLSEQDQVSEEEEPIEDLRLLARRALQDASQNGSLAQAMDLARAEMTEETRLDAIKNNIRNIFSDAAMDGSLDKAFESAQKDHALQDSLKTVRQVFLEAASSTKLEDAFSQVFRQQASEDSPLDTRSAKEVDLEDVRRDVQMKIAAGMRSGALGHALHRSNLEEIRLRARDAFITAADTGRLEAVIASCPSSQKREDADDTPFVDEVRTSVVEILTKAARNGSLSQALAGRACPTLQPVKPPFAPPLECEMVNMMGCTFVGAAKSVAKEITVAELRERARLALDSAEQDGRLYNVLSQVKESNHMLQTPSKCATDVDFSPEAPVSPPTPSSSKRNRRIVGGITREPAADQSSWPTTPVSPKSGRSSMVSAFRMDIYGGSAIGDPSVPCGYDDADGGLEDSSQWSIPAPHGVSHLRVQPGSKLRSYSSSRPASRASKSSPSRPAMDLDLYKEEPKVYLTSPTKPDDAFRSSRIPTSLGSARVTKAGPKLPSISGKRGVVSYPICDMGLSAHQWDIPRALI